MVALQPTETVKSLNRLLSDFDEDNEDNVRHDALRLDELRRLFRDLWADGQLRSTTTTTTDTTKRTATATEKWNAYLNAAHGVFIQQLCDRVRRGKVFALRTLGGALSSLPSTGDARRRGFQDLVEAVCVRRRCSWEDESDGEDDANDNKDENKRRTHRKKRKRQPSSLLEEEESIPLHLDPSILNVLDIDLLRPHRDVQYYVLCGVQVIAERLTKSRRYLCQNEEFKQAVSENLVLLLTKIEIATKPIQLRDPKDFLFPLEEKEGRKVSSMDSDNDQKDQSDFETDDSDDEGDQSSKKKGTEKKKKKFNDKGKKKKNKKKQTKDTVSGDSVTEVSSHRRIYGETWMSIVTLPTVPERAHKVALRHLPTHVIPRMRNPLRLSDYFIRKYRNGRKGTVVPVLALHGLFVLMTEHGLEHPAFFRSLYRLITTKALCVRQPQSNSSNANVNANANANTFSRLLVKCLGGAGGSGGNSLLPAYLVAAMCKRLCRASLTAPPQSALFALALVSNLLRQHPGISGLIHRSGGVVVGDQEDDDDVANGGSFSSALDGEGTTSTSTMTMRDPYDPDTDDPAASRAIESSLWELTVLERHYHPAVSSLAKLCGRPHAETQPLHDVLQDFLVHTYASLTDQELRRNKSRKSVVPTAFMEPKALIVTSNSDDGEGDILGKIFDLPV